MEQQWVDEADPDCARRLTLYRTKPTRPTVPRPPETLGPDGTTKMRVLPSDGVHFVFVEQPGRVIEGQACLDAAENIEALTVAWSNAL